MWKSLEDPSPLKMFGLSKLSKRRQLTGREEVTGPSPSLSLPLLNCRSGQPTFYISTRNWLGQLLGRIITEKMSTDHFIVMAELDKPTAGPVWKTNIFKLKYFLNSDQSATVRQQGPT